MPEKYVALLRGINVGGKNKLAMKDLAALFNRSGCKSVQTYIQSGNIMFCADPRRAQSIDADITRLIKAEYGLNVPVVVRTREEMQRIVKNNLFIESGIAAATLHVVFLADKPSRTAVDSLSSERSPGDSFVVRGREIYLHLPNGAGRSKLTAVYFDSALKTTSTQRNWRTVTTLAAMLSPPQ